MRLKDVIILTSAFLLIPILIPKNEPMCCESFDNPFPIWRSDPVHGWIASDAVFLLNSQYPYYGELYSYLDKIVQGSIHQDYKGITDADEYGTRVFWKGNNEIRSYFTDKKERQHSQGKYMWIKIPLEFIGGCIGGAVGALPGICLAIPTMNGVPTVIDIIIGITIFGGYYTGTSLGVYVVGKIVGEKGSFIKTMLGSVLGSIVGVGIGSLIGEIREEWDVFSMVPLFAGAPIGATIGYNWSLKREGSYSFIDEGELLGNKEKGFKVSVITINF